MYSLETLPKIDNLLKLAGDVPAALVVSKSSVQGQEARDTVTYIKGQGFEVCPVMLYLRAAHRHAGNVGQTAQEYEPKGKADEETLQLYMYTMQRLTKRARNGQTKPTLARAE